MNGLDRSRIALVVATSRDDDAAGRSIEEIGTGYFLTGNLVLTARHVADKPDCILSVRAAADGPEESRWSPAVPQWIGGGDVDAMLLRTGKHFGNWEMPVLQTPSNRGAWESAGYARIAADETEGNRKTQPVDGSYGMSMGQGPEEISLQTNQVIAPTWENYWKGISGAPLFASDTGVNGLIGIITDANRALSNGLIGLPVTRLLNDIHFRAIIAPSFLGQLPSKPWCMVLTRENSTSELVGQAADVLTGFSFEELFLRELQEEPIEIPVLKAVESVENWAATVDALAKADFLIADVTSFEPTVMLLLGIRSVLRRGVTVSVTSGELAVHSSTVPFNVQETRVLSCDDANFYDDLHQAMVEGATNLSRDDNYLDLPAYHAVRAPRPETWAENDDKNLLVLCPFSHGYSEFYRMKLLPIIRGHTRNMPVRMLDLRSPRLVGQALYEQIRWASRCLVDWTGWRPNVFFELGVRLACSEYDPLCTIQRNSVDGTGARPSELSQYELLRKLLDPVEYDPARPREALVGALEAWTGAPRLWNARTPSHRRLPPAATFDVAQASFQWRLDAMLTPPHTELRVTAEQILGKDQERRPERLTLFADNNQFDTALRASVRERWIAAWLYLKHRCMSDDIPSEDIQSELITVSRLTQHALSSSRDPRHMQLRREIREFLRAERDRQRTRESNHNG